MDYKLIAIDLDDTLLLNDSTISERAKRAIQAIIDHDVLVTFATGRMYCSALPYALELCLDLPLITYQGALVKYVDGREVFHRPIKLDIAKAVIEFGKPSGLHINAYIDDELYMDKVTAEGQKYATFSKAPVNYLKQLSDLHKDPTKILFIGESAELDVLAQELTGRFLDTINVTKSKDNLLEISHPLGTKGNALKELAQSLQISREQVIAIGDNLNDLDMIQYAGCGVAVENAVEPLKAAADIVIKSNDDDGVAEFIERLVLRS